MVMTVEPVPLPLSQTRLMGSDNFSEGTSASVKPLAIVIFHIRIETLGLKVSSVMDVDGLAHVLI